MREKIRLQYPIFYLAALMICLISIFSVFVYGQDAQQSETDNSLINVKLSGNYIERLVLRDKYGIEKILDDPQENIMLPKGEYRLYEVQLKGEYCSFDRYNNRIIVVDSNSPPEIKIGGPLKQIITAKKSGCFLELDYSLVGIGGEKYRPNKDAQFVIYQGDRKIASGSFSYG